MEISRPITINSKEEDPFWDPVEPILLGESYLKLCSLAYLVENQADASIFSLEGPIGSLSLELFPTNASGTKNLSEDLDDESAYIEDPSQLLGRRLDYIIKIKEAVFPGSQFKEVFVEYEIKNNKGEKESFRSNKIFGTKYNPRFLYSFHHVVDKVNELFIEYLLNGEICFKVFGVKEIHSLDKSEYIRGNRSSKSNEDTFLI